MPLLERETHLATLRDLYRQVIAGHGRLVLLSAPAGGGKTHLLAHLRRELGDTPRIVSVSCDSLKTPGPLGAVVDIAAAFGPAVEAVLKGTPDREEVFRAILDGLRTSPVPVVLIGEDAHWTDEASLDLFRFLGRRIASQRVLLVITFRDDELEPYHPLRRLLGDLVNEPAIVRMTLPPLSLAAVTELAAGTGIEAGALHARTGGNPFYVAELATAGEGTIPGSIRDAILGRAARLSIDARAVLDAGAILGSTFDPDVLAAIIGAPIVDALDECLITAVFQPDGERLAFQHALIRDVVITSMSMPRRRDLHRRVLRVLEGDRRSATDVALLAHHAEEARDADAVVRYGSQAAREARVFGAHQQAIAQYARVLRFGLDLPAETRANLLEDRSYECYLTGDLETSIADRLAALAIWEELAEPLRLGDTQRWLSRLSWFAGQDDEAERYALQALNTLSDQPDTAELAMACSNLSQLRMLAYALPEAIRLGEQAIDLATTLDAPAILVHALNNVGTARAMSLDPAGFDLLQRSIDLARELGLADDAARAYANLAWTAVDHGNLELAERTLSEALAFTREHELTAMELYLRVTRARAHLARGAWTAATQDVLEVIDRPSATTLTRIVGHTVLGLIAARQGHDPWAHLDTSRLLAEPTGSLMRLMPIHAAMAEVAWLRGELAQTAVAVEPVWAATRQAGEAWLLGHLAIWRFRAGGDVSDLAALPAPIALEIAGDGVAAAAIWQDMGFPLEAARALASTGDEAALRQALTIAETLGAKPDGARIARAMRGLGIVAIPRGPRPQTRANPAQLTDRELQVLELLVLGRTNRDIAAALYLSPRTVGHHVSAILAKLEIGNRGEAAARAAGLGIDLTMPERVDFN